MGQLLVQLLCCLAVRPHCLLHFILSRFSWQTNDDGGDDDDDDDDENKD